MDMDFWHWLGLVLELLLILLLIASIAIPVEFWYDWIEKRENRRLEGRLGKKKKEQELEEVVWLKPEEEVLLEEVLLEEVLLMPGQELRLKLELPEQREENGNESGKESGED